MCRCFRLCGDRETDLKRIGKILFSLFKPVLKPILSPHSVKTERGVFKQLSIISPHPPPSERQTDIFHRQRRSWSYIGQDVLLFLWFSCLTQEPSFILCEDPVVVCVCSLRDLNFPFHCVVSDRSSVRLRTGSSVKSCECAETLKFGNFADTSKAIKFLHKVMKMASACHSGANCNFIITEMCCPFLKSKRNDHIVKVFPFFNQHPSVSRLVLSCVTWCSYNASCGWNIFNMDLIPNKAAAHTHTQKKLDSD